jgi:protein-S-isoprenylcysteine O-methyltransferase Ste14
MSSDTDSGGKSGLGARLLAVIILGVAAWILIKIVVGIIAGVFWAILAVLAVIAVIWAWRTLT